MRAIDADALKRKTQKVATEAWKMKLVAKVETTLNQFIDWINEALTIEPEPHWIPCSERPPERHGWYLCTLKDGRVDCYYRSGKGEWVDNGKKHFFDLYNIRSRYTGEEIKPEQEGSVYWTDWVIAWMPLPEPYRAESEE